MLNVPATIIHRDRVKSEFVALVALTTSLVAMSIDTMLPALGDIARDLALVDPNDRQLVLTAFFGGLSVGQLVFGPVSDSIGRKPALYTGIALFVRVLGFGVQSAAASEPALNALQYAVPLGATALAIGPFLLAGAFAPRRRALARRAA